MKGTLNLTTNKLTIHDERDFNHDNDFVKDTSFWPPEQAAQIFKEEGVVEVTVLGPGFVAQVDLMTLTSFIMKMTRE
jgi:hypothetical protein